MGRQFDQETGQLNAHRIYNGTAYSQDYVGGPGQSQSGAFHNRSYDDDCEVDQSNFETSVRSSGSARDHDELLNMERENVGGPAQSESRSESSSSWNDYHSTVPSSGSAVDHDERYRINRSESDGRYHINRDDSSRDDYRGTDAQNESNSDTISEPANTDTNRDRIGSSRSSELNSQESNTIPPDL